MVMKQLCEQNAKYLRIDLKMSVPAFSAARMLGWAIPLQGKKRPCFMPCLGGLPQDSGASQTSPLSLELCSQPLDAEALWASRPCLFYF